MYKRLYFSLLPPVALLLGAVILVGGQSLASAQQPGAIPIPVWGTDIRVNPTTTAPLIAQRNISMAINPLNPNLVIASYDNNENKIRYSGHATSTDAGLTWDAGRFECCWGNGLQPLGDTHVAFDALGNGYYTSIAVNEVDSGYYVLTTTNGMAWSTPVPIVVTNGKEYHFQSNLAVDPRASGPFARSLYFSYLYTDLNPPYYQGMWLRHSRDGGQTWSSQTKVSDEGREYSRSPSVAVASNGIVYLAYEHVDNYAITNPPELYIDRSTDGGVTWGADRLILGEPIVPIGVPDYENLELVLITDDKCSMARMFHYVQIAVSPLDPNTVYAVWNDGRWDRSFTLCTGTGKHSDIAFIRSTDGGVTWTAPMRVNDDPMGNGRDQYQPTITVAPDGTIGLTWYDRRYNSNGYLYDLAYSQSTDGGITWSPNVRVSDVSSDAREVPDYKSINDVSYRKALVYGPNYALPGWLDTRRGNFQGDFMVDRGTLPLLTPTPTQTQASVTNTPTSSPTAHTATPTRTPGQATVTVTSTPCTLTFIDVPSNNTFYEAIRCLACRGIISGYADGTFRPNNQVTRGQLAKIVSNSAGFTEPPTQQTFEDVPPTNTFYEWIERLTIRGYMTGYNCGGPGEPCLSGKPYFRPFANATRGQTAKIVSNAAGFTEPPVGQTFEDVPPSHTFYDFIQRLATRNVMGGYPCGGPNEPCITGRPYFRPGNDVTRGQSSKIVANAFYPDCVTP